MRATDSRRPRQRTPSERAAIWGRADPGRYHDGAAWLDGNGEGTRMPTPKDILYRVYEGRLLASLDRARLPRHVGIVLDGHRRYARTEGLSSYTESYREGMRRFEELVGWADQLDIPAVTAWVLSKENLARPREELDPYFDVLVELFDRLPDQCVAAGRRLRFIGSMDLLPGRLVLSMKEAEMATPDMPRRLTVAIGYGGRQEIVDAARDLVSSLVEAGVPAEEISARIDADALARHMYSADTPDPDLLIRTSGESRLSGFLLWQSAYAEFVFADVYWPAFRRVDFLRALRDFSRRDRRFGM